MSDRAELLRSVLDRLQERTHCKPQRTAGGWQCRCPAHKDDQPSLSVSAGQKGIVFRCFAGCTFEQVADALGFAPKDLFYHDDTTPSTTSKRTKAPHRDGQDRQDTGTATTNAGERQTATATEEPGERPTATATAEEGERPTATEEPGERQRPKAELPATLTVEELAEAKGLSVKVLERYGVRQDGACVAIPYRLMDGSPAPRTRLRFGPGAQKRWAWQGKGDVVPYGLWWPAGHFCTGYVVLVEGESDCWTLWKADVPALGIPGAQMAKTLQAEHLKGVGLLYVVKEPDRGGEAFVRGVARRLQEIGWTGTAKVVTCEPHKDPNALYQAVGDFQRAWEDRVAAATALPPVTSDKLQVPKNDTEEPRPSGAAGGAGDPFSPKQVARTDVGNAEMLADLHSAHLRYDHKRGRWLVWRGEWWGEDVDGEPVRCAKATVRERYRRVYELSDSREREAEAKWAIRSEGRGRIEAMLSLGQAHYPLADDGEGWDGDGWLLGVANGVVDLRTGELRKGRREDRVTLHAETEFEAGAACPLWRESLLGIFEGDAEVIEYVQRAAGYSLTGLTSEQCLFICHGKGNNGKGTMLETLRHVLGAYAYEAGFAAFEMQARQSIPVDMAALEGRRFVTASEINPGARLNEARVKALTGEDTVNARRLYKAPYNFKPVCKLWFQCNHYPRVADDSYGFWRRVRLIPFKHRFEMGADEDKGLKAKLHGEAAGILQWAIEGCLHWQERGLEPPESIASATMEYEVESNPLSEWVDACCEHTDGAQVQARALYESYCEWAENNGLSNRERLSIQAWGRYMTGQFTRKRDSKGVHYLNITRKGHAYQSSLE